jgi:pilus assembly protein CpaB
MNPRFVIMLLIAIILAVGAAIVAKNWVESQAVNSPTIAQQNTNLPQVYVITSDIAPGVRLESTHIQLEARPNVPAQAITTEDTQKDPNAIVGKITQQQLYAGAVLLKPQINTHPLGLSAEIMTGKRAISLRVDDITGVAGFILPGSETDIIATRREGGTKPLLSKIKILAIDQITSKDQDKPVVVRALTVEVTPEEAIRLINATRDGPLQFALRNLEDNDLSIGQHETQLPSSTAKPHKAPLPVCVLSWDNKTFIDSVTLTPDNCTSTELVRQIPAPPAHTGD